MALDDAGLGRFRDIDGSPVCRKLIRGRLGQRELGAPRLTARMLNPQGLIIGLQLREKVGLLFGTEKSTRHIHRAGGIQNVNDSGGIILGDFHCRMSTTCGGPANHKRKCEPLTLHFLRNMDHFIKRRGDQTGEADDIAIFLHGCRENFFTGNHDAHVDDLVVIAGQDNAHDVLADVVHIAFHRGHEDTTLGAGVGIR